MALNIKSSFHDIQGLEYKNLASVPREYGPLKIKPYQTGYPIQPSYCRDCPVNVKYDTYPNYVPGIVPDNNHVPYQTSIMGPSNVKHIYTGIPNYYPPQMMIRPMNSLYERDNAIYGPHGVRETYGFQPYPFYPHHRVSEVHEYSDSFIPVLDLFQLTHYKTLHDGAFGR